MARPAAGIAVLGTMARVSKYSLAQLAMLEGHPVAATDKERELIRRQAEGMRALADRWENLLQEAS